MKDTRPMSEVDLRGASVVTPTGATRMPLPIRADRIGAAVSAGAYCVDLRGHLVFPGLINAHDHLHVNCVPPLPGDTSFRNSYAWIEAFQAHFDDPDVDAALAVPKTVRLRHGALKNLLAGTTCVAHHDPWDAAFDAADFPVSVLRDYGWAYAPGWLGYGPPVRKSFIDTPADHPWMIHLAEGTDAVAQEELSGLDAMGCLASNSVLVHGVGLGDADVDRVIASGAAVVWCPASNHALLGRTLDPRRLQAAGRLALGTDSRLSGARDLLEEMRGVQMRGELDPRYLLELVTTAAARILRIPERGNLEPGARADLVIVRNEGGDPRRALAGTSRCRIRAVVRDGVPRIADPDFAEWFARAGVDAVPVTLDGRPKLLARPLADPALAALEPGLELEAGASGRQHGVALAGAAR